MFHCRSVLLLSLLLLLTSCAPADAACPRSKKVYRQFLRQTGFPKGRPGYVVDHIIPLACGGPDRIENLQWQTISEAKAKDKIERRHCAGCKARYAPYKHP